MDFAPIHDIDFTMASVKKRKVANSVGCAVRSINTSSSTYNSAVVSEPTDEELARLYHDLSKSGTKSAVLSLHPQYCDDFMPRIEKGIYIA